LVRPLFPQKISTISECWHNTKSEQQHIEAPRQKEIYMFLFVVKLLPTPKSNLYVSKAKKETNMFLNGK